MKSRSALSRRELLQALAAALASRPAAATASRAVTSNPVFVDVAASSGITFQHDPAASPEVPDRDDGVGLRLDRLRSRRPDGPVSGERGGHANLPTSAAAAERALPEQRRRKFQRPDGQGRGGRRGPVRHGGGGWGL